MKNKHINRREALQFASMGLASTLFARALGNQAQALSALSDNQGGLPPKALIIFLRGGNDGVNTIIPRNDQSYNALRETIAIPFSAERELDANSYMHPGFLQTRRLFDEGKLALMHKVHYDNPSLSHFTGQDIWEKADPTLTEVEGYLPKLLDLQDPADLNKFRGASVSSGPQRAFLTPDRDRLLVHIPSVSSYSLSKGPVSTAQEDKLRLGLGLTYGRTPLDDTDGLVRQTGQIMQFSEAAVRDVQPGPDYTPANGTDGYPGGTPQFDSFGNQLKEAVQMLKLTSCQVTGVELGGFDNHSGQGGEEASGDHFQHLQAVAQALDAIDLDWNASGQAPLSPLLTIVMSEFGRTSRENDSRGTDHAHSSVMMAMGNNVNGGVYNMDSSLWPDGHLGAFDPYLPYETDFRAVLAEAFERHFCVDPANLKDIIRDWPNVPKPDYLNYLS